MRKAMAKRWGIWALAWAAGIVHTDAALLTYSVVANNGGAYYESGAGGTFNLTQFDSSLGTLQSAVLTITASSLGGHVWVDNEWTAAGKIQLQLGTSLLVTTPELAELTFTPEWTSALTALAADNEAEANFSGTDSAQLNGTLVDATRAQSISDLSLYIGSGQLTYSFWGEGYGLALPLSPLDMDGRVAQNVQLPSYGLTAQIIYNYAPLNEPGGDDDPGGDDPVGGNVPEPGTMSMALVLGGYALVQWRRRWRGKTARRSGVVVP